MSDFEPMTMNEIEAEAKSKGCRVIVADANHLQFDLDNDASFEVFESFYSNKILTVWPTATKELWLSKSGNRHAVVTLGVGNDLDIPVRIALQSMGGSDLDREFAAYRCWVAGSNHPILLYKPL